jgi:phospholipase C
MCGTSQHPLDDVTRGEALIKATYEAIRNSPIWSSSLFVITWDEHGGFFDHVPPPPAVPPGDTAPGSSYNLYAFSFNQYGPRVPAIVISPLIPRNLIDHRIYDHASIPATLEKCFGLSSMTDRDASANNLMSLVSLSNPRSDAPAVLPAPAVSGVGGCDPVSFAPNVATATSATAPTAVNQAADPLDSIDEGNLPGFLLVALRSDLALSSPGQSAPMISRFNSIKTRADASQYMDEVRAKVHAARTGLS